MAKRALLIGCNYPGTKAELHGCINDVNRMYKCLVDRFGFVESDVTVMVDTDKRSVQPTGVNIKKVLGRLIDESEPGDVLFFHYSGHGTQVPAESGDEEDDGLDEAIVPTDLNLLTDDDFRVLFKNIKHGVAFTFISDSCHSGGLIDHEKEQIGPEGLTKAFGDGTAAASRGYDTRSYDGGFGGGYGDSENYDARGQRRGYQEHEGRGERHGHHEHGGYGGRREERHSEDYESRGERHGHHEHGGHGGYGGDYESSGERHGHNEHDHRREQGDGQHRVPFQNKSLSIETLTEMLSQQSGHAVKPGNIRTSLFDMFGDDASPTVKVFVNLISSRLGASGGDSGGGGGSGGIWGSIGGLAMDFLKAKINDSNSDYTAPVQNVPSSGVSQSGHAGAKPPVEQRVADDIGILVSGCQSNETSADANPSGNAAQAYGALSNGIQTVLASTNGPITNGDLVRQVRAMLKKQGFSQHPCLYCSDRNVDSVFIC